MNAQRYSHRTPFKGFLVLILVVLTLQTVGISGKAAPISASSYGQQAGSVEALTCSSSPTSTSNCDIQIVLMIDDSGSMRTNDPGFGRNAGAKNLVDILDRQYYSPAVLLHNDDPGYRVPKVEVAIVHFTDEVVNSPVWIPFGGAQDWKKQLGKEIDSVKDNPNFYHNKIRATGFLPPFNKAKELLASSNTKTVQGGCVRRSIMLFTDGTPENSQGIPAPDTIAKQMNDVLAMVKGFQDPLSAQEKVGIYVTGFKVSPRYWNLVADDWAKIASYAQPTSEGQAPQSVVLLQNSTVDLPVRMEKITAYLSDIESFALKGNSVNVPQHVQSVRFTLYNPDTTAKLTITDPSNKVIQPTDPGVSVLGKDQLIEVWQIQTPGAGAYKVESSTSGGTITELLKYQTLSVQFSNELGPFQIGQKSNIALQLFDEATNVVLPSDNFSPAKLNLNFSITPDGTSERKPVNFKQDGDAFQIAWTPVNAGEYQFGIDANLVSAEGNTLQSCSGNWILSVPPLPGSPIGLKLVVGPSAAPQNNTITVPVNIAYDGKGILSYPISWTSRVISEDGTELSPPVTIVDEKAGRYQLIIDPVNGGKKFEVHVNANPTIDGQSGLNLEAAFTINLLQPPVCDYVGPWTVWFWLIVIILTLALIVLLFFRLRAEQRRETDQNAKSRYRVRYWNLLFLPLALLLVLAVLNRWWCFIIPHWMFLVAILVLLIIILPIRFLPWETAGGASSGWLLILLAALGLLILASLVFRSWILWLLMIVVSIALARWALYAILFYVSEGGLSLGLVMPPACVPEREVIALPLHLDYEGDGSWHSRVEWSTRVTAEPGARPVPAKVNIIDADHGDYELCVDPVTDAEWISIWVSARTRKQDQDVTISASASRIEICAADDLKDLEGIGAAVEKLLHANQIYTFKQLAEKRWTDINGWLNDQTTNERSAVKDSSWGKMMNPKTWPQQARLREKAKETGREKDWKNYFDYKAWLFDGIEPDEYARPENMNRREEALKWPSQKDQIPEADIEAAKERFSKRVKDGLKRNYEEDHKPEA